MIKFALFALFALFGVFVGADLWQQDVTSHMKIGLSETGYRRVDLKCGVESFLVNVTLDADFEGVAYTRGSFDNKTSPCFKSREREGRVTQRDESVILSLRIPFDECRTVTDASESRYVNTLVVQHDPDFIVPGDAAFTLECHLAPKFAVTTNIVAESSRASSRIVLVDADPSAAAEGVASAEEHVAKASGDTVSFVPRKSRDEL